VEDVAMHKDVQLFVCKCMRKRSVAQIFYGFFFELKVWKGRKCFLVTIAREVITVL